MSRRAYNPMNKKALLNTLYALSGIVALSAALSAGMSATHSLPYTLDQLSYNVLITFVCGHGQFLDAIITAPSYSLVPYWGAWLLAVTVLPVLMFAFYIFKPAKVTLFSAIALGLLIYNAPTVLYIFDVVKSIFKTN